MNTAARVSWAFGFAAVSLLACGSSERSDPKPEPEQSDDSAAFCRGFYAALCDHVELCACDAPIVANCRGVKCDAPLFAESGDPIARGTLIYDQEAADALFARLRDPSTSCDGLYLDLGLDSYEAHSLGGVFRGTLGEGSSCARESSKQKPGPTECAVGLLCLPDAAGALRCTPASEPGESCTPNAAEPDSNCLLRQGPDSDNEFESAEDSVICVPSAGSASSGTCSTAAPNGSACEAGAACESGRCLRDSAEPGVCSQKLSSGSPCQNSTDCETNYCSLNGATRLCVPQAADGAECTAHDACRSGNCLLDTSASSGVCGAGRVPTPLGGSCTNASDCASRHCSQNRCAPGICGLFD